MNALILRCDNDDSRKAWQSRLQGAIYHASVGPLFRFNLLKKGSKIKVVEEEGTGNLVTNSQRTLCNLNL